MVNQNTAFDSPTFFYHDYTFSSSMFPTTPTHYKEKLFCFNSHLTGNPMKAKIRWPKNSAPTKQYFCFPIPLIRYLADNPSTSKVYNKMIQTCKYFFDRNPILVVKYITRNSICQNGDEECDNNESNCCVNFDINKIISKFWLLSELNVTDAPDFIPLLVPKIYRNEIYRIELEKFLTVHDTLKLLTSNIKNIDFWAANVTNDEGNTVRLKEILEAAPNVETFSWHYNENTANATMGKNITKLENLKSFELLEIPQTLDIKDLTDFIMNHKHAKICLYFAQNLTEEYTTQIDVLIDIIIESKVQCYIHYDGQNDQKYDIMKDLYGEEIE